MLRSQSLLDDAKGLATVLQRLLEAVLSQQRHRKAVVNDLVVCQVGRFLRLGRSREQGGCLLVVVASRGDPTLVAIDEHLQPWVAADAPECGARQAYPVEPLLDMKE